MASPLGEQRTRRWGVSARIQSDAARHEHFINQLREKLKDPAFRRTEGFPVASDEDILRLWIRRITPRAPTHFSRLLTPRHGLPRERHVPS